MWFGKGKTTLKPIRYTSGRAPTDSEIEEAAQQIATILHGVCCRYDHTEGCPWELYDQGWQTGAHKHWKAVARYVIDHAYDFPWDSPAAVPTEQE